MENIYIVSAADNQYALHLAVMLTSLCQNANKNKNLFFYLIHSELSIGNQILFKKLCKKYQVNLSFLSINKELFDGVKITAHISEAAYYRILIPHLLPDRIEKVIYLDCDLIIKDDISKLWRVNIPDHFLAAVENPGFKRYDILIPKGAKYFNSGVLVLNVKKWRENSISDEVLQYIENFPEKIIYWDQDALNAVLYDKWLDLDPKWNQQTNFFTLDFSKNNPSMTPFLDAVHFPSIIHYTGSSKPWHDKNNHPLKYQYFIYFYKLFSILQ